ncbi:Metallo-hydrolase/oxidoreductase [Fistulina hepatica ATCC 64428]|nr:Metallo-hydrolase/oxidoreductase [Fistulina hepatica ATCC 64428]
MQVLPVLVSTTNYAYLLIDEPSKKAAVVDPYDVAKVAAVAQSSGVEIIAGITTHHHWDHSGGNKAEKYPTAKIYGGSDQVPALTDLVHDKDEFTVGDNIHVKCLATPCHTRDSICFYATDKTGAHPGGVFTGDTLFVAGCGRFFEGNGEEMDAALKYIGALPDKTIVYNGHEYTAGNVAFALSVDPDNKALSRLQKMVEAAGGKTPETTVGEEKEWNVFMRLGSEAVRRATSTTDEIEAMDKLRRMKNRF